MGEVRQTPCTTAHGRKKGRKHHKVLRTNAHSSRAETFALLRGQLAPLPSVPPCRTKQGAELWGQIPSHLTGKPAQFGESDSCKRWPLLHHILLTGHLRAPHHHSLKFTLEKRRGEFLYSPIFHSFKETCAQGTDSRVKCRTQREDTLLLLPLFCCINALGRDLGP